jgi:hypothetical protein
VAHAKRKPKVKTNVIRHGGKDLPLPVLAGPVGMETPALRAKYPNLNQAADLEVVDYYLSALDAVKSLGPSKASSQAAYARLFGVVHKNIPWSDRARAIKGLQSELLEIRDPEEKLNGVLKPGGDTLKALVDLGDIAEQLLGSDTTPGAHEFIHMGAFDRTVFGHEFKREFHNRPAPAAIFRLLSMMELDAYVLDIRWMAYMFGTATIETGMTYAPVDEGGKGDLGTVKKGPHKGQQRKLAYYLPVKVKRLPDGTARVTEQDGDQFIIPSDGASYRALDHGVRGSTAVNPKTNTLIGATETYVKDDGVERRYFGRGYCQITWWNSYAAAGGFLGRGLDLLFNPELVKDPAIAYQIMSVGMRTGTMFANGLKIGRFIAGSHCDYLHARQMVNGMNGAQEVADAAKKFERILLASKHTVLAGHSHPAPHHAASA